MFDVLTANPKLDAFVAVGGWAQYAPQAYRQAVALQQDRVASKELAIVFGDNFGPQMPLLKDGLSHFNVGQRPYDMAYKAVEILNDLTDGKTVRAVDCHGPRGLHARGHRDLRQDQDQLIENRTRRALRRSPLHCGKAGAARCRPRRQGACEWACSAAGRSPRPRISRAAPRRATPSSTPSATSADDLRERMAATYAGRKTYADYDAMLADPEVEAVIIATSDAFHVAGVEAGARGRQACAVREADRRLGRGGRGARARGRAHRQGPAGRPHEALRSRASRRRTAFIDDEMGELLALKAWYCDSTHRYAMTDAVQPLHRHQRQRAASRAGNPKADLRRYYMLAHGSHLVDTARFLGGEIDRGAGPADRAVRRLLLVRRRRASPTARSAIST